MASGARSRSFLTIDAVGTREMVRAFTALERTGIQQQIIAPTLEEGSALVLRSAQGKVPVDKGKLRDSLRRTVYKTRARIIAGYGTRPVARFVEFGAKDRPAQPYMRPALDENRRRIEAICVRHMRATLERLAKGGSVFSTGGKGRFKRSKAA